MPGAPRGGYRRPIPLREIGIRFLGPAMSHRDIGDDAPTRGTVSWVSCQMGVEKDPAKPSKPVEPEFIYRSVITVVRNPLFVEFSNPCDKFS